MADKKIDPKAPTMKERAKEADERSPGKDDAKKREAHRDTAGGKRPG